MNLTQSIYLTFFGLAMYKNVQCSSETNNKNSSTPLSLNKANSQAIFLTRARSSLILLAKKKKLNCFFLN
ncbi:MAG: hypothetical protein COA38_05555 [Fluviicola sp.]|nr:MAG: hypothetical protein COA38_05555 [Fluviicola sp.]